MSAGPVTCDGKMNSAGNATQHGLSARAALLRSEDLSVYKEVVEQMRLTFGPKTPGEARLVFAIADCEWRRERLAIFERRAREEHVERELAKTEAFKANSAAVAALAGVRGLADMAEGIQAFVPAADVTNLAPAIQRVLDLVEDADAPVAETTALLNAANALSISALGLQVPSERFQELARAARHLEEPIRNELTRLEALVESERARLEQEAVLEDEDKARLVERHRARIMREEERLLGLLKQLRELSARPGEDSGSFVRLEVRLVGKR